MYDDEMKSHHFSLFHHYFVEFRVKIKRKSQNRRHNHANCNGNVANGRTNHNNVKIH
jgi:hypothetical protein